MQIAGIEAENEFFIYNKNVRNIKINKEERYSRVRRLSDTRYSAK